MNLQKKKKDSQCTKESINLNFFINQTVKVVKYFNATALWSVMHLLFKGSISRPL